MITHVGQRVQCMHSPWNKGTVSRITREGFTVVFDWPLNAPDRKRGEPRERYRYRNDQADGFVSETFEEIVILEDDGTDILDETERIELHDAGIRAIMEKD